MNKITILGSGTSTGVPILGCNCIVCQSNDPRNKRLRTSALLETKNAKTILIDTSPDLRTQLLSTKTQKLDAVIITHDHADHIQGMDDVRPFTFGKKTPIPVFTDAPTVEKLKIKFSYIFQRENRPVLGGGIPLLELQTVTSKKQEIAQENFQFFSLPHGYGETLCLMHEKLGYITDCHEIPEQVVNNFRDAKLEVLIIDCVRYEPHDTHLSFELALEYIQKMAPAKAVLTHLGHDLEYLDLINQLERRGIKNVFPAFDGQTFLYSNA